MHFVKPEFLWALFFALMPVVLHFVRGGRPRVIEFSSTMFFSAASEEFVRARRLSDLLTLLLRIFIIAAFAIYLAEPVLDGAGASTQEINRDIVILLDNSPSMTESGLSEARKIILRAIENAAAGKKLTLIAADGSILIPPTDVGLARAELGKAAIDYSIAPASVNSASAEIFAQTLGDPAKLAILSSPGIPELPGGWLAIRVESDSSQETIIENDSLTSVPGRSFRLCVIRSGAAEERSVSLSSDRGVFELLREPGVAEVKRYSVTLSPEVAGSLTGSVDGAPLTIASKPPIDVFLFADEYSAGSRDLVQSILSAGEGGSLFRVNPPEGDASSRRVIFVFGDLPAADRERFSRLRIPGSTVTLMPSRAEYGFRNLRSFAPFEIGGVEEGRWTASAGVVDFIRKSASLSDRGDLGASVSTFFRRVNVTPVGRGDVIATFSDGTPLVVESGGFKIVASAFENLDTLSRWSDPDPVFLFSFVTALAESSVRETRMKSLYRLGETFAREGIGGASLVLVGVDSGLNLESKPGAGISLPLRHRTDVGRYKLFIRFENEVLLDGEFTVALPKFARSEPESAEPEVSADEFDIGALSSPGKESSLALSIFLALLALLALEPLASAKLLRL
ncbi:MAG: BatA domain-containing protein [Planctomycetes bacterium]|nr:BatA domain-containing protein [Planctomycetota bacterium]